MGTDCVRNRLRDQTVCVEGTQFRALLVFMSIRLGDRKGTPPSPSPLIMVMLNTVITVLMMVVMMAINPPFRVALHLQTITLAPQCLPETGTGIEPELQDWYQKQW